MVLFVFTGGGGGLDKERFRPSNPFEMSKATFHNTEYWLTKISMTTCVHKVEIKKRDGVAVAATKNKVENENWEWKLVFAGENA